MSKLGKTPEKSTPAAAAADSPEPEAEVTRQLDVVTMKTAIEDCIKGEDVSTVARRHNIPIKTLLRQFHQTKKREFRKDHICS